MKKIGVALTLLFGILLCNVSFAQSPVHFNVTKPTPIKAGQPFEVKAVFNVIQGWYIYAPTGRNEGHGMIETKVQFKLPEGVKLDGEVETPTPKPKGMYEIFDGRGIVLKQKFVSEQSLKPGTYDIMASVTYQTCNKQMCLPPYTEDIKLSLVVQ